MRVPSYLKQIQMGSPGGGRCRDAQKAVYPDEEQMLKILTQKHIKAVLGRPIKRIIFDQQGEIILNVGDLISHQAILRAKQADVLDVLLESVYRR